jgi:hypothetical protein
MAIFTEKEAQRFAALWAGSDTGNPSEVEAMGKGRAIRRMVAERNLRVIDVLELPEIREALDDQMQPIRLPIPDVAALQAENDDLRRKLAVVVPKLRELADELKNEQETSCVFLTAVGCFDAVVLVFLVIEEQWGVAAFAGALLALGVWALKAEGELMDTWQIVKEKAVLWYSWSSRIFLGLNVLFYFACCVVAGGPVGPVGYIAFLFHCCQWKVG